MLAVLEQDIKYLPGVGARKAELLQKELNIRTFGDLLYTFPFRYIDRTKFYTVKEVLGAQAELPYIQLRGKMVRFELLGKGRGKERYIAYFSDGTATIELVFFQGIKWQRDKLKLGQEYIVFGRSTEFKGKINMVHPEVDEPKDDKIGMQSAMQGVYSSTEVLRDNGLGQRSFMRLQAALAQALIGKIEETLPPHLVTEHRLMSLQDVLLNVHFPQSVALLDASRYRLKFEELFYIQLSLLKQRSVRLQASQGFVFSAVGEKFHQCYENLPFPLTNAQKRVIKEIRKDMGSGKQMNRLLQGDVGSGKTLVALLCALIANDNGYQAAIMAPTEILAQQHYSSIQQFLEGIGIQVGLLTGSTKKKDRKILAENLLNGSLHLLVGTHALIEDTVQFNKLGFVVIDEQHRFGVEQRARLWGKSAVPPHVLVMTATPIPRTLAMTLYGDLDVSVIDELPPGRQPVKTIHFNDSKRLRVFGFMKEQIKAGRQIYVVYPLIKESEKMDYKNLEDGYESVTRAFPPPEYVTTIVHGKMTAENKAIGMRQFVKGQAHIMVATSVIEVGVNIPNASVMVIESAERFGLSQLHQLRGRVGRGAEQSYCILMTDYKLSKEAKKRTELMCSTNNGFEIAEADLQLRGPGDMEGTQQSGMPINLRIADLARDGQMLEIARNKAFTVLEEDADLSSEKNALLCTQLKKLKASTADYSVIS
ncbi:MAG: ATP-dependent DNA helicase RecG [Prevotellaceae bacterium]|jgi:ATP-dependent DNA helicase RecG|nr:ATP-dependent DNA helicase RecG [Prevotellaceae bacterium]